jgi:hypothetical protein
MEVFHARHRLPRGTPARQAARAGDRCGDRRARSFAAIGQWAADVGSDVLHALGTPLGAPDEATFRRAFALVNADALDAALAHGIGAVLGQVAAQDKSNEIPAVRELLKAFADWPTRS